MSVDPTESPDCSGEFVWCVKLHEDELKCVSWGISRKKPNGREELVNEYRLFGKERPALVLYATRGCRNLTVWYTCTSVEEGAGATEVSAITGPLPRAWLKHQPDEMRRIPNKVAWVPKLIRRLDRTVFDAFLKQASLLLGRAH